MFDFRRVVVCCARQQTGGTELLHQLVHELVSMGLEASIAYYPFGLRYECPESFLAYQATQVEFTDDDGTLFVIPETATWIVKQIKRGTAAIWWLSVDNYFFAKKESAWVDLYWRLRSLGRTRLPLFRLKRFTHFAQSEYAADFLRAKGITPLMLTDYLSREHFDSNLSAVRRQDWIVYNPKKGIKITRALILRYPEMNFVPIENMTPAQVRLLFGQVKLYIDFGNHPGKDRIPREAAMAGCCVITGRQGSAGNPVDVPIADAYKLDEKQAGFIERFGPLAHTIFSDFETHTRDFDEYRTKIAGEQLIFKQQVVACFTGRSAL